MTRSITQRLAPLATAGAVAAFAATLTRHHPDPSTAAESAFLAWLAACALGALAVSRHAAPTVVGGGLLLTLVLCLPAADGTRGALAVLLLVATVGAATWRLARREALAPADFAALALAWQCLLRSDRFLAGGLEPRSLVWLVALPLTAAAAGWWFARRRGRIAALMLLAAVAVVAPGFGVVPVAVLVLVAALYGENGRSLQAAAIASLAAIIAIGRLPAVAPAVLVLAAALALRGTRLGTWLPWLGALAWSLTGGGAPAIDPFGASGSAWLLIVLPALLLAPAATRPLALAALALALGYRSETATAAMAPAFALAALALPGSAGSSRRFEPAAQAGWGLAVLAFVALRTSYPWLRPPLVGGSAWEFVAATLGAVGWPFVLLALAVATIAGTTRALGRTLPRWCAVLALLAFCLLAAARQPRALTADAVLLTEQQPSWRDTRPREVRELVVDSFLNRAEGLRAGEPVAHLILSGVGGRRRLTLNNTAETADWAAQRLGLAVAPPPWLHWFSGDGTLARRFRTTWRFEEPLVIHQLEVIRDPALPSEVAVALTTLEAR